MQTNQVLYHLGERGIEWNLQPWLRQQGVPLMAYSPTDQGRLLREPALLKFAKAHGRTPAQVALGWLLAQDGVIAIPKASRVERVEENHFVLLVAQVLKPREDVRHVVEQIAEQEHDPAAPGTPGQFIDAPRDSSTPRLRRFALNDTAARRQRLSQYASFTRNVLSGCNPRRSR